MRSQTLTLASAVVLTIKEPPARPKAVAGPSGGFGIPGQLDREYAGMARCTA